MIPKPTNFGDLREYLDLDVDLLIESLKQYLASYRNQVRDGNFQEFAYREIIENFVGIIDEEDAPSP
jgi:NADPH-dependent 7-cyano-7-deazaguanine reductase QueF